MELCLGNKSTSFAPQTSHMLLTDVNSVALRRAMQMVQSFNNILHLSDVGVREIYLSLHHNADGRVCPELLENARTLPSNLFKVCKR